MWKQNKNTEWLKKAEDLDSKMKCIQHIDRKVVWNKFERKLAHEMQKLREEIRICWLCLVFPSKNGFKLDSDEDTEDMNVPSIETI